MKPSRHAKPRILLVADVPNWVFVRHCKMLEQFLGDEFQFTTTYQGLAYREEDYDLIYPLEFNLIAPEKILTPAKYITGIRSHITWMHEDFPKLISFLATAFQRVHVVSRRLFEIFAPHLPGVAYITHGVDTDFFTPRTRADQSGQRLRLGWAGNRTNGCKRFEEFVAPLGQLPGVELAFCGYQDRNLALEEMPAFYDSLDAYVCSSSTEGNNNALMEAASMQRAIITTDNGTVAEYLRPGESALIVEPQPRQFAEAVIRLRDDPVLRVALGQKARAAVVAAFDWKARAMEHRTLFRSALAKAGFGETSGRTNPVAAANPAKVPASGARFESQGRASFTPMNIAYVSKEFGPDNAAGMGSYLQGVCPSLVANGHRVFLIADQLAQTDKKLLPRGIELVETQGSLPHQAGHFFSDNQEYSYRVLNTLRSLAQKVKLDVIEFPVCRAEGFATIRAKRLLNEFAESKLIVNGCTPLSLLFQSKEIKAVHVSMYCDFEMEDYCVRHADVVTAPTSALAKYFQDRVSRNDIRVGPGPMLDLTANQVVGQASRLSTGRLALETINAGGTPDGAGGTPAPLREQLLDNYIRPLPTRPWLRAAAKKVSVIIPFYNQGQYLAEAVQSVRDSGWPDLEIIVVNDGSSEASSNEVFEGIEGVVKIRKPNGGLSSARNAGIQAAKGDYLLMLDADDKIHPDYIATAVRALENNPALSYLTCHAQNFGVLTEPYIPVGFVPALMPFLNTDGKCANVYRREVFSACGGYDEALISYEDWDLLLTIHEHGLKGDVLPAEFLLYRRHFDSMVFTVANPHRVELVQQLMLKHRGFFTKDPQMIAVLLAGLWQWQAIRADDARERETGLLAEEPWRIKALEISELRREQARQTKELCAEHTRQTDELRAEYAREIGELRAEYALKLKQMRVQQVYANGLPVRTSELKFMLRKYLKGKLQSLMPPPRSPAEASEQG